MHPLEIKGIHVHDTIPQFRPPLLPSNLFCLHYCQCLIQSTFQRIQTIACLPLLITRHHGS